MIIVMLLSFLTFLYYSYMGYQELFFGFESVNNYSIELAIKDSKSRFDNIIYHLVCISFFYMVSIFSIFQKYIRYNN